MIKMIKRMITMKISVMITLMMMMMEDSLQSRCMVLSFLEKSTTTSSSLKRAAKEPSTILEVNVNTLKMIMMFTQSWK